MLAQDEEVRAVLSKALLSQCRAASASSAHVLFVEESDRAALVEAGFSIREGVQFHWVNDGYQSTADFLARLSHDKRKKVKQDSKYVAAAGITYRWLEGASLLDEHLEFFFACYANTYREHWSSPYLTLDFFKRAHSEGALHFVLVLAERAGAAVACALNVLGDDVLYGRYWGTTEPAKGLHFETCYTQAIAYCIANEVGFFEGGAQGEHKLSRGLTPVRTYSAHHVSDSRFAAAIRDFLRREAADIESYVDELERSSPFKKE